MPDVKEVYDMVTRQVSPTPAALERQRKRQMRHMMNRRLGGFAAAAVVVGVALLAVRAQMGDGGYRPRPGTSTGAAPSTGVSGAPKVAYVLDLNTGLKTPLPNSIVRSLGTTPGSGQFAASPDGSVLAYVGTGEEGLPQIFIGGVDGTGVRQMTHDPTGASWPAWSPDGSQIAYMGSGSGNVRNLFSLDVATDESTLITDPSRGVEEGIQISGEGIQFTPDGSSILYTHGPDATLRTVPVAGGKSVLIQPGKGLNDAFAGSLSPDGSLVTYMGSGSPLAPDGSALTYHGQEITHAGPGRFLSKVDGTGFRFLPGAGSNPSGTWSLDGTRIVCSGDDGVNGGGVIVIDVATGDITRAVEGRSAIWLDDHRLLVEI